MRKLHVCLLPVACGSSTAVLCAKPATAPLGSSLLRPSNNFPKTAALQWFPLPLQARTSSQPSQQMCTASSSECGPTHKPL